MQREICDFYDLKRQRVRQQRTGRDDKPINEMKISYVAQQPSAFQRRNLSYSSSLAYPLTCLRSLRRRAKAVITTCVRMLFLHDILSAEGTASLQSLFVITKSLYLLR